MQCETYNGHGVYEVVDVAPIVVLLEKFVPIKYDEISVDFVTEAKICELHAQFLNNADPTDVITFPADIGDAYKVGEICISVDEALKYPQYELANELTLYLVHGWLHLAGYDDIAPADRVIMREMEQKTLQFLRTCGSPCVKVL